MASKREELLEWLEDLPLGCSVGIDDGGLALRVVDHVDVYFEVGGMPEAEDSED